jgi:trans-2,3-dihydro-3-hydroxyanthranilate isomerase
VTAAAGLRVSWLDVFTDRPFAGNPLAVVLDADALDSERMQALARELGLSETVFVLEDAARLRIFTPGGEIPLAGHPVVGAALELERLGRLPAQGRWVFRTGAGEIPVELADGTATMTQAEPVLGPELDREEVARALRMPPEELLGTPRVCSTGLDQGFAQVRDAETLARLEPDPSGVRALDSLGLAAWAEDGDDAVVQRYFVPQLGIAEDAATGSAAGALGALRVFGGSAPGRLTVRQGAQLGRPSTIEVEVDGEPGRPRRVRVAGRAVLVLEAELRV